MRGLKNLALILLTFAVACDDDFSMDDAERVVQLGVLRDDRPDAPIISLPTTPRPGVPFIIGFHTMTNSCGKGGHTEVFVVGNRAFVTPYDTILRYSRTDVACADIRLSWPHTAEIRFLTNGSATIELRSRSLNGDTVRMEFPIMVTR